MTTVFFSYSHKDETMRNEMQSHLSLLKRNGTISVWHDRRIGAGDEFDKAILKNLNEADIILLLISSDFLSSDYCWGVEVTRAMERHEAGEAIVIPVILRPCLWKQAPFGKLLAAPTDGKPVTRWPDRDEAFFDVARMIHEAARRLGQKAPASAVPRTQAKVAAEAKIIDVPRSSNLAIRKTFSERDKDVFLHKAFDHIEKFFEGSLEALSKRNSEVETNFRKIDANRFTCAAYIAGKKMTACTIWTGGDAWKSAINYFGDDSGGTSTLNESLRVELGEHDLYLKPLFNHGGGDKKLTFEGASEYIWEQFIEPLQRRR